MVVDLHTQEKPHAVVNTWPRVARAGAARCLAGGGVTDRLRANANLVDSLGSAARHGGSALADAPVLLRRVLDSR